MHLIDQSLVSQTILHFLSAHNIWQTNACKVGWFNLILLYQSLKNTWLGKNIKTIGIWQVKKVAWSLFSQIHT